MELLHHSREATGQGAGVHAFSLARLAPWDCMQSIACPWDMARHAVRVKVRLPLMHRIKQFSFGTGHAMPLFAGQHRTLETLGCEMGMNIDGAHMPPLEPQQLL